MIIRLILVNWTFILIGKTVTLVTKGLSRRRLSQVLSTVFYDWVVQTHIDSCRSRRTTKVSVIVPTSRHFPFTEIKVSIVTLIPLPVPSTRFPWWSFQTRLMSPNFSLETISSVRPQHTPISPTYRTKLRIELNTRWTSYPTTVELLPVGNLTG